MHVCIDRIAVYSKYCAQIGMTLVLLHLIICPRPPKYCAQSVMTCVLSRMCSLLSLYCESCAQHVLTRVLYRKCSLLSLYCKYCAQRVMADFGTLSAPRENTFYSVLQNKTHLRELILRSVPQVMRCVMCVCVFYGYSLYIRVL
jgi:hypothetical protein